MQYQIFTIPVLSPDSVQDQLNLFCSQKRVVAVNRKFIEQGDESAWSFCITYTEGENSPREEKRKSYRERIDYKEVLNEDDFIKYAELRELRKSIADEQGSPVYTVFTNEQLASMITKKVSSLERLRSIEGIGSARIEKYGEQFVDKLMSLFDETAEN